ncbi:hypothetical protein [Kocuria sp. SL71]|uniref:hypothetical protein n=1 Tax=Kocuria sp. SL71 TaxID=2995151 RepID=UPI002275668D|nr:hypothetical protein [Kocuria sp. SL71]MCY1683116.1 hypothetical protein [Kocuria sp. SL71]
MAKPTPMLPAPADSSPEAEAIATLMPTTFPSTSTSAPPELPGLMEASVWITLRNTDSVWPCEESPWP